MAILYKDESYTIVGACFDAYNELGSRFLEAVYQEALSLELQTRKIPFVEQPKLEIKAVKTLDDIHRDQLHNYLKATSFKPGFLINFGDSKNLIHERIIN